MRNMRVGKGQVACESMGLWPAVDNPLTVNQQLQDTGIRG